MLILTYFFIINQLMPLFGAYVEALLPTVIMAIVMIVAIVSIIGAVAPKFSSNLGTSTVNGIFRGIGYLGKTLINAIGWIVRKFLEILPKLFKQTKQTFLNKGMNAVASNLLATLIVAIVILIVI